MTDTRKEFDDYFVSSNPLENLVGYEREVALESWQACQQLNNKRIQQLLAVIEVKEAALRKIARDAQSRAHAEQIADEALAITPESVELVEYARVQANEIDIEWAPGSPYLACGTKLYGIKMKGK